jgi:hypothetical protein
VDKQKAQEAVRVFENRVLTRKFEHKRDEVAGSWRKLHNEELHNFCCSPCIIRMMKSWRIRCVRHVAERRRGNA